MKNKKKKDVSDNSDSDKNDNLSSPLKTSMSSEKTSKSKNSPKKKTASDNDNGCHDNNEPRIEEVSENKIKTEKPSEEITDSDFRETNSENKSVLIKSVFNVDELTSDDEIYTLQCPENYIKQNLCNRTIDFTKSKQVITHNKEIFLLELLNCEEKFITLAVPEKVSSGSLIKMPLKGHIVIQKVVEMPHDESKSNDDDEDDCDQQKVSFPDNIKVRHPLLGVEWKAHIDLANKVIRKEHSLKENNKTKKDKSLKTKEAEIRNLKRENSNSQIIIPKKKKKKSDV